MQKDFIDGSLDTAETQAIVSGTAAPIQTCRQAGWTVIGTLDTHGENYADTQEGIILCRPNGNVYRGH